MGNYIRITLLVYLGKIALTSYNIPKWINELRADKPSTLPLMTNQLPVGLFKDNGMSILLYAICSFATDNNTPHV